MYPNTNGSGFGRDVPLTPFTPWAGSSGIPSQRSPWEPSSRPSSERSGWVDPARVRPPVEPVEPVEPVAPGTGTGIPTDGVGPETQTRVDGVGLETPPESVGPDPDQADRDKAGVAEAGRDEAGVAEADRDEAGVAENGEPTPVAVDVESAEAEETGETADTADTADTGETGQASAETGKPAATGLRPGDLPETRIVLWPDADAEAFRARIRQAGNLFVDDPDFAVTAAATVVSEAVSALAATLQHQQAELDPRRDGAAPDTETLRVAVRRYREFLERVLAL
ncbi:hypothetical protein Pme01_17220 [Planosporangium mesophilum]|uniref:Uncharacterized protein n=2 Tax=Planosporangium mesophilum TaxID=689768 RepID=A0A8J3TIN2_9ACTN|nr:hypothetical protein [Planosporangium mesophilum]NJC83612.1 hypothetical protein [Planosporangium mesophilum]GII22125.1 hypothetical protein Pme01_17220 [Planosporangium mesophilum]